jgi:NTP pyrophosphatase (non-canonical NTP hydrolase)
MSEIEDALGDILVTIIIQAEMQGLKLVDCLESAYNIISQRTGKMVDGQFLKDK